MDTIILAPAGYELDPELGSDQERPWRLIEGLARRGLRVVVVARTLAQGPALGKSVVIRLLPGRAPVTPLGRLLDRFSLYMYARQTALDELRTSTALAIHHFGPCSRRSPSLIPRLPVPFVYGPMPGFVPSGDLSDGDWSKWIGLPRASRVKVKAGETAGLVLGPVAERLWRRTISRADAVTVEARANVPREREDSVIVPCVGLDTDRFSPDAATQHPGRIVAVGSLIRRKGFDVLIKAIAVAAPSVSSLHVMIAGDGPLRRELQALAADLHVSSRVQFLGGVRRQDLPTLYRSAIAACHPARLDNFPSAPCEAMACGLPILVSDFGALPELAGEAGFVHSTGDHSMLADQMIEVVRSDRVRKPRAVAARDYAVARYSSDAMCETHVALYSKLQTRASTLRASSGALRDQSTADGAL